MTVVSKRMGRTVYISFDDAVSYSSHTVVGNANKNDRVKAHLHSI